MVVVCKIVTLVSNLQQDVRPWLVGLIRVDSRCSGESISRSGMADSDLLAVDGQSKYPITHIRWEDENIGRRRVEGGVKWKFSSLNSPPAFTTCGGLRLHLSHGC